MTFELLRWYVEERLEDERTERTTERSYCSGSAWTLASLLTGQGGGGGEGGLGKHFSPVSCLARVTSLRDNNRKRSRIDCCYGTPDTGQHGQTFNFYLFPDPKSQ